MTKFKIVLLLFTILVFSAGCRSQNSNNQRVPDGSKTDSFAEKDCQLGFCYEVLSSTIETASVRRIDVFLDRDEFSADNLKKLSRAVSEKFPKPEFLLVEVYTVRPVIDPAKPKQGNSGTLSPTVYESLHAIINRGEKQILIRFTESVPTDRLEKIYLDL